MDILCLAGSTSTLCNFFTKGFSSGKYTKLWTPDRHNGFSDRLFGRNKIMSNQNKLRNSHIHRSYLRKV